MHNSADRLAGWVEFILGLFFLRFVWAAEGAVPGHEPGE